MLNFFRRMLVRNVIKKRVIIIEDCNNVIFIAISLRKVVLTKKCDVNHCKIEASKKFNQSEKLR